MAFVVKPSAIKRKTSVSLGVNRGVGELLARASSALSNLKTSGIGLLFAASQLQLAAYTLA